MLQALIHKHGIQPKHFPGDVVREMLRIGKEVVAETAELGSINRRIYENWAKFRAEATELSPFTEQGAYNQRDL